MPERLVRNYRYARGASRLGAYALYGIAALSLLVGIGFCLLRTPLEGFEPFRLLSVIAAGIFSASVVLLAEFLRHFWSDPSPFGERQFTRLVAAAALLGLRAVFDATVPSSHTFGSLGEIQAITHADLDLKIISVVIFLVCLAMVVRYGDALKEDSDSFV